MHLPPVKMELNGFKNTHTHTKMRTQSWVGQERGVDLGGVWGQNEHGQNTMQEILKELLRLFLEELLKDIEKDKPLKMHMLTIHESQVNLWLINSKEKFKGCSQKHISGSGRRFSVRYVSTLCPEIQNTIFINGALLVQAIPHLGLEEPAFDRDHLP